MLRPTDNLKFTPNVLLNLATSIFNQCGRHTFRPLVSRAQLLPSHPIEYVGIRTLLAHVDDLGSIAVLKDVACADQVMVDYRAQLRSGTSAVRIMSRDRSIGWDCSCGVGCANCWKRSVQWNGYWRRCCCLCRKENVCSQSARITRRYYCCW